MNDKKLSDDLTNRDISFLRYVLTRRKASHWVLVLLTVWLGYALIWLPPVSLLDHIGVFIVVLCCIAGWDEIYHSWKELDV